MRRESSCWTTMICFVMATMRTLREVMVAVMVVFWASVKAMLGVTTVIYVQQCSFYNLQMKKLFVLPWRTLRPFSEELSPSDLLHTNNLLLLQLIELWIWLLNLQLKSGNLLKFSFFSSLPVAPVVDVEVVAVLIALIAISKPFLFANRDFRILIFSSLTVRDDDVVDIVPVKG